jgi:hypothetical protein
MIGAAVTIERHHAERKHNMPIDFRNGLIDELPHLSPTELYISIHAYGNLIWFLPNMPSSKYQFRWIYLPT